MKSFGVRNYKRLSNRKMNVVDFAPITILTGRNGTGKSSFIESFSLILHAISENRIASMDLASLGSDIDSLHDVLHSHEDMTMSFRLVLDSFGPGDIGTLMLSSRLSFDLAEYKAMLDELYGKISVDDTVLLFNEDRQNIVYEDLIESDKDIWEYVEMLRAYEHAFGLTARSSHTTNSRKSYDIDRLFDEYHDHQCIRGVLDYYPDLTLLRRLARSSPLSVLGAAPTDLVLYLTYGPEGACETNMQLRDLQILSETAHDQRMLLGITNIDERSTPRIFISIQSLVETLFWDQRGNNGVNTLISAMLGVPSSSYPEEYAIVDMTPDCVECSDLGLKERRMNSATPSGLGMITEAVQTVFDVLANHLVTTYAGKLNEQDYSALIGVVEILRQDTASYFSLDASSEQVANTTFVLMRAMSRRVLPSLIEMSKAALFLGAYRGDISRVSFSERMSLENEYVPGPMREVMELALQALLDTELVKGDGDDEVPIRDESYEEDWLRRFGVAEKVTIVSGDDGKGWIEVTRDQGRTTHKAIRLGMGQAQLIPVILACGKVFRDDLASVVIQEPESHLHPAFQSQLADMMSMAVWGAVKQKLRLITPSLGMVIETHSEYIIRRFQYLVAKGVIRPGLVRIVYFDTDEAGLASTRTLTIREDGSLSGEFGSGFLDEASTIISDIWLARHSRRN